MTIIEHNWRKMVNNQTAPTPQFNQPSAIKASAPLAPVGGRPEAKRRPRFNLKMPEAP